MEDKEIHLVKKVSKELGLTYKQLGEEIGYSESNLNKSVYKNILSLPLKKSLELYIQIRDLKEREKELNEIRNTLKEVLLRLNL